jgi:hypothetical protein
MSKATLRPPPDRLVIDRAIPWPYHRPDNAVRADNPLPFQTTILLVAGVGRALLFRARGTTELRKAPPTKPQNTALSSLAAHPAARSDGGGGRFSRGSSQLCRQVRGKCQSCRQGRRGWSWAYAWDYVVGLESYDPAQIGQICNKKENNVRLPNRYG